MHLDPGRGERPCGGAEQFGDLFVGRLDEVRYGGRQQRSQRRPGPGGAAQGEEGVHPRAWTEPRSGGRRACPDVGGVGDHCRIADAVDLQDGTEGWPGTLLGVLVSRSQTGDLDTQREPHTRVVPGRDIGGPGPTLGQALRSVDGEGGTSGGEHRGGRARQAVCHRVQERAQQPLRLRQQHGLHSVVERYGMGGGRHGSREVTDPVEVGDGQRTGPPRVVVGGTQPRQQQSTGSELQGEEGGRAPERGRGRGLRRGPRAGQYGQRVAHRQQQRRHTVRAGVGSDDGQIPDGPRCIGRAAAVRMPEGDPAGTGGI